MTKIDLIIRSSKDRGLRLVEPETSRGEDWLLEHVHTMGRDPFARGLKAIVITLEQAAQIIEKATKEGLIVALGPRGTEE